MFNTQADDGFHGTIDERRMEGGFVSFMTRLFASPITQIIGGSLLLAFCAQLSFPVYFSPVPVSAQTFAVLFIGATMGKTRGFLTVLAYIIEGAMGLPFFSKGNFGFAYLMGPTGGYIFGFLAQAYLAGWFCERRAMLPIVSSLVAFSAIMLLQLLCGAAWLSLFVGVKSAIYMGIYSFMLGEFLKACAVMVCLKIQYR